MMKHIAVYGSLRKGEYNHPYFLKDNDIKAEGFVPGFDLHSLGSYPAIKENSENSKGVYFEVFEVDQNTFGRIDGMERGAGYYQIEVTVEGVTATAWAQKSPRGPIIAHGDWTKRKEINEDI